MRWKCSTFNRRVNTLLFLFTSMSQVCQTFMPSTLQNLFVFRNHTSHQIHIFLILYTDLIKIDPDYHSFRDRLFTKILEQQLCVYQALNEMLSFELLCLGTSLPSSPFTWYGSFHLEIPDPEEYVI